MNDFVKVCVWIVITLGILIASGLISFIITWVTSDEDFMPWLAWGLVSAIASGLIVALLVQGGLI